VLQEVSSSQIVAGLTAIANENLAAAIAWHALLGSATVALLLGWRPSQRTAVLLLSCLPASVSAFAFQYGNPFNGVAFGFLTGMLLLNGISTDAIRLRQGNTAATAMGGGLIVFGWLYPHFLQSQPLFMYALAAPMGLIPCPTLAVLTGVTVLLDSGLSRSWSIALGAFGLFYGAFGALRLDVGLDVGLLAGALSLLTMAAFEPHRTQRLAAPVRR